MARYFNSADGDRGSLHSDESQFSDYTVVSYYRLYRLYKRISGGGYLRICSLEFIYHVEMPG